MLIKKKVKPSLSTFFTTSYRSIRFQISLINKHTPQSFTLLIIILFFCVSSLSSVIAQSFDSIRIELENYNLASLRLRQHVMPTIKRFGYESKQMDSLNLLIHRFDSLALVKVEKIIENYGWLGKSQIGEVANTTLFQIIQHAKDNSVREKYYPLLAESANKGEPSRSDLATMRDRILINNGEKQLYGTQSGSDGKLFPLEDPKGVNKRRRKVGLKRIKVNNER